MCSKEELANDFRKLGVKAADSVMLQASVRGMEELPVLPITYTWPSKWRMGAGYGAPWRNLIPPAKAFMRAGQIVFSRTTSAGCLPRQGATEPEWEKP